MPFYKQKTLWSVWKVFVVMLLPLHSRTVFLSVEQPGVCLTGGSTGRASAPNAGAVGGFVFLAVLQAAAVTKHPCTQTRLLKFPTVSGFCEGSGFLPRFCSFCSLCWLLLCFDGLCILARLHPLLVLG